MYPVSVFHRKHTVVSLYCQEFVALFHCFIKTADLVHVPLTMSSLVHISVSVSTRRIMVHETNFFKVGITSTRAA